MQRKVILSRKGFDSKSGGKPSPVLDGKFISLPIPRAGSGDFYSELKANNQESYLKVMQDLGIKGAYEGHVDPDLRESMKEDRPEEWRGLFGQSGTSQATLKNGLVGKGDIFLFFGWFKEAKRKNGVWKFKHNAQNIHAIFGFLEVDEVFEVNGSNTVPQWIKYHPHYKDKLDYDLKRNDIYMATEFFSAHRQKPGWGVFEYNDTLVLTKKGSRKRSLWELPPCFKKEKGNFKCGFSLWSQNDYGTIDVQQLGMGDQELYISSNPEVVAWAESLIVNSKSFI